MVPLAIALLCARPHDPIGGELRTNTETLVHRHECVRTAPASASQRAGSRARSPSCRSNLPTNARFFGYLWLPLGRMTRLAPPGWSTQAATLVFCMAALISKSTAAAVVTWRAVTATARLAPIGCPTAT